jgi:putative DNA-invertase from lambdoid prophage Rac
MQKITAVYVRISTEDQRADSQEQELRRYCDQRQWTELRFYCDQISGVKAVRPELDKLVRDARHGYIGRVVCFKLDRLGRSLTHLALLLDELDRLRIPLVCTSQGIDTSSDNPVGKLQLGVLMAVAEFERALIRERTKAGLAAARHRGQKLGRPSIPPVTIAQVLKLRGEGKGIRSIGRALGMPPSTVSTIVSRSRL